MILTQKDINKIYTDTIRRYMDMGYWINTNTMHGTQGETAKVDLTNGKHIIRILLEEKSSFMSRLSLELSSTYKLSVIEYSFTKDELLWNDKGNILYEEWWYMIGSNNKAFTDNKDECIALIEKSIARQKRSRERIDKNYRELKSYDAKVIVDIVNKHKGKAYCKEEDIDKVIRHTYGYTIKLNNAYRTEVFVSFKRKLEKH